MNAKGGKINKNCDFDHQPMKIYSAMWQLHSIVHFKTTEVFFYYFIYITFHFSSLSTSKKILSMKIIDDHNKGKEDHLIILGQNTNKKREFI